MQLSILYTTFKNKAEATALAHRLLAEKLIACANIVPDMTSVYEWEGITHEDSEVAMLVKTTEAQKPAAMARIAELHSYDCPCIIELKLGDVHFPFAEWIFSQIND